MQGSVRGTYTEDSVNFLDAKKLFQEEFSVKISTEELIRVLIGFKEVFKFERVADGRLDVLYYSQEEKNNVF